MPEAIEPFEPYPSEYDVWFEIQCNRGWRRRPPLPFVSLR